jgi:hypothetical protein
MIDKSLPAAGDVAVEGIETLEVVLPDIVENADGSVEITLNPGSEPAKELSDFDVNLAEHLDESVLSTIASDQLELVNADMQSRKEWMETFVKGLDVLGLKYEERTEPWDGACGVYSPVLTEAAVRFQAESIMETFPAAGPVKTQIIGAIDKMKEQAAERVRTDMNYQLTERMVEFRPEHERMLYSLGLSGSAFKKVYFDPQRGRQVSLFVPAEDVIVPYGASELETAPRVTHIMRRTKNDIAQLQASGFYCKDVDLGEPSFFQTDVDKKKAELEGSTANVTSDDRYHVYEIHVDMHIEEDPLKWVENDVELPSPYVLTVDKGTDKVLALRRNWLQDDPKRLKRQHFVHYVYIPGFGFYGLGLIHIIGGYARAGTSIIRQLVDAGTLSNLPGGLKTRGLRIKGDNTPISPGEFRDVDVASGSLRDNVMPLPYKEPSQTLLSLLQQITDEGRRLGAISDMDISDMSAQAPVGTTLALLERTLKPMSAVQARVHFSMKQEFKLLAAIIRDHAPDDYEYDPESATPQAKKDDYARVEVIPVSDPNSATMAQRIVQYQAALELASRAPQIYDLPLLHRQMLEVIGIKNAAKLVPTTDDQTPKDPISENMAILKGQPVKAFIYQDQDAHIAAHTTFLQDPMIAQQIGQNPMAQQMMAAMQAHISEHLAFAYRRKIEEQLGVPLPPPDEQLPESVEVDLSRLVAQAAGQLLQKNTAEAAQQQAMQQAQDPLIQMQQKELDLKAADLARKERKDIADAELKEKSIEVTALRTGVMGRAQELQLQAQDREAARKTALELAKQFRENKAGESGVTEKPDAGV